MRVPRPSGMSLVVVVAAVLVVGLPTLIIVTALRTVDGAGGGSAGPGSHDGPSLIARDRFARALEKAKDEAGPEASLVALRLDPERAVFVVRRADGSGTLINVLADLDAQVFPGGTAGPRGLSLNRIDPAVPERLVRRAAERQLLDPGDVDYLALSSAEGVYGGGVWSIFFEGATGPPMNAHLDGSNLRAPGAG